jgi:hypothetical protein
LRQGVLGLRARAARNGQSRNKCKASTCRQRIDGKIFDASMPSWRKELQDFECADHQNRNTHREEPLSRIGKSKR